MPPLIGPQRIATALRAVGLDDDAARLVAWADPARREREAAEQALADLDTILTIDVDRWREEIGHREVHLEQFHGLPEEIWEAHRRVAAALDDA